MKLNIIANLNRKTFILFCFWNIGISTLQSQSLIPDTNTYNKHEVTLVASGLYASLAYELPETHVRTGMDVSLGVEYKFLFNKNFGIGLGAEYQGYNAMASSDSISGAYTTTDYEMESFEFRYTAENLVEEQQVGYINIPVLLHYENKRYGFYIKAGAKIGIPVTSKYSTRYNLHTSGYYNQYNVELFDPEFMGFGSYRSLKGSGNNLKFNTNIIGTFEFGAKLPLSNKHNLYGGLFIDYGINNIKTNQNKNTVNYVIHNNGVHFQNESILNSSLVEEVKTMAFGIKLRYSIFNF